MGGSTALFNISKDDISQCSVTWARLVLGGLRVVFKDYKNEQESGIEEEEYLTTMVVKSLDLMVGFDGKIGEEMYLSVQAGYGKTFLG